MEREILPPPSFKFINEAIEKNNADVEKIKQWELIALLISVSLFGLTTALLAYVNPEGIFSYPSIKLTIVSLIPLAFMGIVISYIVLMLLSSLFIGVSFLKAYAQKSELSVITHKDKHYLETNLTKLEEIAEYISAVNQAGRPIYYFEFNVLFDYKCNVYKGLS